VSLIIYTFSQICDYDIAIALWLHNYIKIILW